jgi:hypothetical protein
MSFEVDLLEREERYRARLNRLLAVLAVLIGGGLGAGFWWSHRQEQVAIKAAAAAKEAADRAAFERLQMEFSADSTAAADRLQAFKTQYAAEPVPGSPILIVQLPTSKPVQPFIREVWDAYASTVDPDAPDDARRGWFRRYYVDVMNRRWFNSAGNLTWEGEQRPTGVLVPEIKQRGTELEIQKPTFPQIVRAQEQAGIRLLEENEMAGSDSAVAQTGIPAPAPPE